MKAMKKKMYVSPETEMRTVELEKGLMKASVVDKEEPNSHVTAGNQKIEGDYDFTKDDPWQ